MYLPIVVLKRNHFCFAYYSMHLLCLLQVGDDKVVRSHVHQAVREKYEGMDSTTIDKKGKKYIKVCKVDKKNTGKDM